jgi:hypothetical protein
MEQFRSLWTDFHKFYVWGIFENLLRKFKFRWNMTRMTGTLHDAMVISRSVLLIKRNVQTKIVEKIKTQVLYLLTFSRKSCRLWDTVETFGRYRLVTDNNLERCMSFLCWITNTRDMRSIFLLIAFECNNGYAKALQCYVYKYIASLVLV